MQVCQKISSIFHDDSLKMEDRVRGAAAELSPECLNMFVIRTATRAVREHCLHCGIPAVESWAANWISGVDQTPESAGRAYHPEVPEWGSYARAPKPFSAMQSAALAAYLYAARDDAEPLVSVLGAATGAAWCAGGHPRRTLELEKQVIELLIVVGVVPYLHELTK
jgi:hypothetical protein